MPSSRETAGGDPRLHARRKFKLPFPVGSELFKRVNVKVVLMLIAVMWLGVYAVERHRDSAIGETLTVTVEDIVDGDTFVGTIPSMMYFGLWPMRTRFRLRGIDAPELDQPYGREASYALENLLLLSVDDSTEVVCRVWGKDAWGRLVVDVFLRRALLSSVDNVQRLMVERGAAWAMPTFGDGKRRPQQTQPSSSSTDALSQVSLKELMETAIAEKRGLWAHAQQATPQAPWQHRRLKRNPAEALQNDHALRRAAAKSKRDRSHADETNVEVNPSQRLRKTWPPK